MSINVPPSSNIPNFHDGLGLDSAKAASVVTQATRDHLKQQGITLKDPLGKPGAYGIVLAATDAMQRPLAVKVVLRPLDRQSRKRHQRESEVLSWNKLPTDLRPYCHLAHKVTAPKDEDLAKDATDGVQPYLVMSRIDGKEVHAYVGERHTSMPHRVALVRKMFDALHRLHKAGVVHGDISPRNLLIEPDDQVRFVDFGGGRDIDKAGYSAQSAMAVGGTQGYAPRSQLTGEEQASINTDLRAMAAVAYDALTGTLHDDSLSVAEKREKLKNAGVPNGIQKIILKGLREPDKRLATDPNVFASAEEVIQAIDAWELQKSRLKQIAVFGPLLAAACILLAMAWWRLESEVANRYSETARVLREQVDAVGTHPATKQLIEQADEEIRSVKQREQELSPSQRRQRLDIAADSLRKALDTGRKLEALVPRFNTLGTMREKIRWQPDAKALSTLSTGLNDEFLTLGKLLDQGNVSAAEGKIEIFANRLVSAWEANERARSAASLRADLSRWITSVPKRLTETPRFADLQQDATRADEQWQSADSVTAFDLAEKTYNNLQQRLGEWLEKEENQLEKSDRLQKSQSQASRIAEQLQQSQLRNSELAAEIDTLKSQIAKQAELNQKDRLAKESAESQTKDLMAKQTAAESDFNQLKATLQEKLRIEGDLAQIQQQLADRNLEWEDARAQAAKLAKERDNAKDKADRMEKLLASGGSANPTDLVKMSEQEILKIESIDTKDWDATNKALNEAKLKYREISMNRIRQLQDFSETSPTIRKIDAELASQESVVRKALQLRDQADHEMFIELDGQLVTKRAGRKDLIENVGRLPTSSPVVEIDKQIATLLATQAKYTDGHERAIGKQRLNIATIMDTLTSKTLKPGKVAGELLVIPVQGIDIRFHWCPAGSFQMGSPSSEKSRDSDEDSVKVTHSQGFWMMETECWRALWVAVMGSRKSSEWTQEYGVGDKYPASYISHDEATQFARKLNWLLEAEGVILGYEVRLPTEAQWEYAVRAGSTTAYCFGDDEKKLGDYAWFDKNSGNKNHPVGTKKPNAWGIHDGHGSVWEWCSDWYDSKYSKGPLTDPVRPSTGSDRVLRGGSWDDGAADCRSGDRLRNDPSLRSDSVGFRLALSPSGIPK
jgi:formylglycine-generating enzyme required for sulfatase activity/serine/threonine protein kinase